MATQRLIEVKKKGNEPKDSRFEETCSCGDAEEQRILGGPSPSCPVHGAAAKKAFEARLRGH